MDKQERYSNYIRRMTKEERQRSKEREKANNLNKCVSCGNPSKHDFCAFCMSEE